MTNDDLRAAWARKLPGVEPSDQQLTAFALGVEVGAERYDETWDALQHAIKNYQDQRLKADRATAAVYGFHYAMKDAGWHPGRTDDNLCNIIKAKGAELADALQVLRMVDDNNRVDAGEDRKAWRGDFVGAEVRRVLGGRVMTITLTLPLLLLAGFSLLLFIGVTILAYSQGLYDGRGGLGGAMEGAFLVILYAICWALPSLLTWAVWATWLR